jgi:steroid delta-isomerase-like uncharacterized protein
MSAATLRITSTATALVDGFNTRDLGIWEAQVAEDAEFSYPGFRGQRGRAAARAYNAPFLAAFSDLHFHVHQVTVDGDRSIVTLTARGTHDGPLVTPMGTFQASGKVGEVDGVFIVTTRNGVIVREETYWDRAELMAQLTG